MRTSRREGISEAVRSGSRLWVFSDLHANSEALRAARKLMRADDCVVFLGDLLTYGCDPIGVMEQVARDLDSRPSALLWGNHDQLYRDLISGNTAYYEALPGWLRESVDWTMQRVDDAWFSSEWGWLDEISVSGVLFDHANPYPAGDWTYVNDLAEHVRAATELRRRGYGVGVFGHTHRAKLFVDDDSGGPRFDELSYSTPHVVQEGTTCIMNPGALGQPRSRVRCATVASLRWTAGGVELCHQEVGYDVAAHCRRIEAESISSVTKAKLLSYFEVGAR